MIPLISTSKAFADTTRVRILVALREGELCVCELCDALNITQSTLSTHLQVIRNANLVTTRRVGKWTYYAIATPVQSLLNFVFDFFNSSLAVDRRLATDARRLRERLALRRQGSCCIGYVCCKPGKRLATK